MRKTKITLLAMLVMAVSLFGFVGITHADDFRSGTDVLVKKDEIIDHSLFVTGDTIEVNGTVKGDVFCAGKNVTIDATVEGDVLCAGMNVTIRGTVSGDVRAAGQVVALYASVGHNASLAGSTVTTGENSKVTQDIQAAGDTVLLGGIVGRDAAIAGATMTVDGSVGRNLKAAGENIRLGSKGLIAKDFTYYSQNQLQKTDGTTIGGAVVRKEPQTNPDNRDTNPIPGMMLSTLMLLLLAFWLLALFPRDLKLFTDIALTKPGTTLLIGLAACIGVPLLIIASLLTVVGALVALFLLFGWLVIMLLSGVLVSYYVGRLVFAKSPQHPFLTMLVGLLIMAALLYIPLVNILTVIITGLLGSGMVIKRLFNRTPLPRYETVSAGRTKSRQSK